MPQHGAALFQAKQMECIVSPEVSEVIDSLSGTTSVETLDGIAPDLPPLPVGEELHVFSPPLIPDTPALPPELPPHIQDLSPEVPALVRQSSQPLRQVYTHQIERLNEALDIDVMSEPGEGGASQRYRIVNKATQQVMCDLQFQIGNPNEIGINGISNEALLAIVADRLEGFQRGKYRSDFGELALNKLKQCMRALRRRTQERIARGVEGTLQR